MTRARDNQRGRLYEAEKDAARAVGMDGRGQTIGNGDLQGFVDRALAKRAVADRWPGKRITVVLKRGGRALGYPAEGRISLPLFARNEWTVLHEVAHCLVPAECAWHGPEFAGVLLFLVQTVLGKGAADALRATYRERRVRKSNARVPAPMDREERRLRVGVDAAMARYREAKRVSDAAWDEVSRARADLSAHRAGRQGRAEVAA